MASIWSNLNLLTCTKLVAHHFRWWNAAIFVHFFFLFDAWLPIKFMWNTFKIWCVAFIVYISVSLNSLNRFPPINFICIPKPIYKVNRSKKVNILWTLIIFRISHKKNRVISKMHARMMWCRRKLKRVKMEIAWII